MSAADRSACATTGASHASHLGCPSAYSSRVSYVKIRMILYYYRPMDSPTCGTLGLYGLCLPVASPRMHSFSRYQNGSASICQPGLRRSLRIGPAVRADFRRLYPANAKTPTCCPSDDNRTKVTNSVTSARSLWWHVGPYFWPADLTRTANPIPTRCV